MKKVYVRFYDKENLGDDLFLEILSDRYCNEFTIVRSGKSGLFVPTQSVNVTYERRAVSYISRIASRLFKTSYILLIPLIRRHDLMVYIGGSLFMESNLKYWLRERRFYRLLHVPYYILGSNVGPIYTENYTRILRSIFQGAKDVCFRDISSYNMFKDILPARVASDIVFTLNKDRYAKRGGRQVVFSIIDGNSKFDPSKVAKYEQEIVKLIERYSKAGYRIILMSFCKYEGDENAIGRVLAKLSESTQEKTATYFYRGDIKEALELIAKSSIIVASRFHAAILGLLFNKRVLPIAYSDKTTSILKDMGFTGPVVDIRQIDEFDADLFDIDSIAKHDVSDQRMLAEKQFQELDEVLIKR